MATLKKSRYKRTPKGERGPIRLTSNDFEILKLFGPEKTRSFNYLTAELIAVATDRHPNGVQHRLRKLYDHEHLERYHIPQGAMMGSNKVVYFMTRSGARALSDHLNEDVNALKFDEKSYHQNMEHFITVNWFHVLTIAADRKVKNIDLVQQYTDGYLNLIFKHPEVRKKLIIRPDYFFGLQYNKQRLNFYLEVQRPTRKAKESSRQKRNTLSEKFKAYTYFWKGHGWDSPDFPQDDYPDVKNWKNMRVLVLTDTSVREHENLIKLARKIDEKGRGIRIFWFAKKSDFDIHKPESLFEPVWRTPSDGDDRRHSILE